MLKPPGAVIEPVRAVRLGHERIEAEHDAHSEDRDRDEERAAHPDGANRRRPQRADHDGVDDSHAHPADLRQDHGAGEPQRGEQLSHFVIGDW